MATAFILAPSSTELSQSAQTLNLVPFALGPSHTPYTARDAPIPSFFVPRSAPPNLPSVPEGHLVASFRGRTLVAQQVDIPKGFRGVILSTTKRPDRGGLEERRDHTSAAKPPPTAASASAGDAGDQPLASSSRAPRATRGAGQVALSRPVARAPPRRKQARKRILLDSDDDDDGDETPCAKPAGDQEAGVMMERSLRSTPKKRKTVDGGALPAITVQAPTPRKARTAPVVCYETAEDKDKDKDDKDVDEQDEAIRKVEADIVPSPATENDPPAFSISPAPTETEDPKAVSSSCSNDDTDRAVRVLCPTSIFSTITLWTADAPLAGFRSDELSQEQGANANAASDEKPLDPVVSRDQGEEAKGAVTLRKGWWRVGGAGEGGDEFVRGLGEWLGLVEMINRPIYLEGLEDDDGVEDA